MRSGTVATWAVAGLWILVGASFQGQKKQVPFPIQLFNEAKAEDYIGETPCKDCHPDAVASFDRSVHSSYVRKPGSPPDKTGCEACHGPGAFHLDQDHPRNISYSKLSAADVSAACLRCHADVMKPTHWSRTAHSRADVSCVSCHRIHTPEMGERSTERVGAAGIVLNPLSSGGRAAKRLLKGPESVMCGKCHRIEAGEFMLNSHHPVPEGVLTCSDCHDLHPTRAAAKKVTAFKDKCVACHASMAGPFVYEHDPVAGLTGDGCTECHKPHGSHNPRLLKSFSRGLCAQCHTDKAATHNPGQTCWAAGCHASLHGSNTSQQFLSP